MAVTSGSHELDLPPERIEHRDVRVAERTFDDPNTEPGVPATLRDREWVVHVKQHGHPDVGAGPRLNQHVVDVEEEMCAVAVTAGRTHQCAATQLDVDDARRGEAVSRESAGGRTSSSTSREIPLNMLDYCRRRCSAQRHILDSVRRQMHETEQRRRL